MRRLLPALLLLAASAAPAQELRDLREEAREVRQRLRSLESEEGAMLEALDALEQHLATERAALRTAEEQVEGTRAALEFVKADIDRMEAELEARLEALKPRLVVRYKLGRAGYLPVLLSAGSIDELLARRKMLARVIEADVSAMEQIRQLRRDLAVQAEKLAAGREELEALRRSAAARLAALEAVHAEREGALEALREEKTLGRRMLADLARARRKLVAKLRRMESGEGSGFAGLKGRLPLPTAGSVEEPFGERRDPRYGSVTFHKGIDIRAPRGAKVKAVAEGRVAHARWMRGYGNLVIVDHGGGYYTLMAHLDRMGVEEGDRVRAGEVVGLVGDTGSLKGAYLYFEIREQGQAVDPADWLSR